MFHPYNLLGSLVFSLIGFGAWRYGRALDRWKPIVIGLALMIYPYFIRNPWLMWGIGASLLVLLWFQHDE